MVPISLQNSGGKKVFSGGFLSGGSSGVARAFPGGRVAHQDSLNEEENEKSLRKNEKKWSKFGEKLRKMKIIAK